jgi:oligopeptide transport system substrate-binding protein
MSERLNQARLLMKEAGYGPDHHLAVAVLYPTSSSTAQLVTAVAAMWQQIFVDVKPENVEFQIFQSRITAKDYEAGVVGAAGSYDDYEDLLSNFSVASGERDFTGYPSAKFEQLFEAGSQSLVLGERRRSMQQAEATVLADVPAIPLYFDVRHRVVNPALHGMEHDQLYPQSRYLSLAD